MKKHLWTMAVFLPALLLLTTLTGMAQGRTRGRFYTKAQVETVIRRVEERSDFFKRCIDEKLDRSALDKTRAEDNIWEQVKDLENALDRLRDRFDRQDSWRETRAEVVDALREADDVNRLLKRFRHYLRVSRDWDPLRYDLNTLAGIYDLPRLR